MTLFRFYLSSITNMNSMKYSWVVVILCLSVVSYSCNTADSGRDDIDTRADKMLDPLFLEHARAVARQSAVMLRNDNNTLSLKAIVDLIGEKIVYYAEGLQHSRDKKTDKFSAAQAQRFYY
jgi:hypothetical protein